MTEQLEKGQAPAQDAAQLAQPGNDPNQGIMIVLRHLCSACRKGQII